MHTTQLPADYALVLQQLGEDGGDGFDDLVEMLRLDRGRLGHILQSLHNKGLIIMKHSMASREAWLSLSTKGRRLMANLWPEANFTPGY